jgi:hypothetical protein
MGGRYEADLGTSVNRQRLYIGGDAYSVPAVYVNQGGGWTLYYICRDYLGSITHLVNSNGTVAYEYSYDVWGRLRNPANQTAYTPGSEPELLLNRGYTGHEHLPAFGLVNMSSLVVIIFIFYKLNEAVSKARNLQLYPLDNTLWRG